MSDIEDLSLDALLEGLSGSLSCEDCKKIEDSLTMCPNCGTAITSILTKCTKCSLLLKSFTDDDAVSESINSSETTIKMIGSGSYQYQRNLLQINHNKEQSQQIYTEKSLTTRNYQSTNLPLSPAVKSEATRIYLKEIQNIIGIKRTNNRIAIIVAIINRLYMNAGIYRTPRENAKSVGIHISDVTAGMKLIDKYTAEKKISLLDIDSKDELKGFVTRFIKALNISPDLPMPTVESTVIDSTDTKLSRSTIDFVIEIISKVDNIMKKVKPNNSTIVTKAIGTIYLINVQFKLGIRNETIQSKCDNISVATFMKYYKNLKDNVDTLDAIFLKYGLSFENIQIAKGRKKKTKNEKKQ